MCALQEEDSGSIFRAVAVDAVEGELLGDDVFAVEEAGGEPAGS